MGDDPNKAEFEVDLSSTGNLKDNLDDAAEAALALDDRLQKLIRRVNELGELDLDKLTAGMGKGEASAVRKAHALEYSGAQRDLNQFTGRARRGFTTSRQNIPFEDRVQLELQRRQEADEIDAEIRRREGRVPKGHRKPALTEDELYERHAAQSDRMARFKERDINEGRRAGPKLPLTEAEKDERYLEGLRTTQRRKQLAIEHGLRAPDREQPEQMPNTIVGAVKYAGGRAASALGVSAESMASAGLLAAAATAGVYIGKEVVAQLANVARAANRADAAGFTTEAERKRMIGESLPLIGGLMDDSRSIGNYLSGEAKNMGHIERLKAYDEVEMAGRMHIQQQNQQMLARQAEAKANLTAAQDYTPYIVEGPRVTMLEKRAYQEKDVRAAGINRQRQGEAGVLAAEARLATLNAPSGEIAFRRRDLEQDRKIWAAKVEEQKRLDSQLMGPKTAIGLSAVGQAIGLPVGVLPMGIDALFARGNTSQTIDAARQLKRIDDELLALKQQQGPGNAEAVRSARVELARQRGEIVGGQIDQAKGDKGLAEHRAESARSYNQRIGAMGPEGRTRAEQEGQLIRMAGGVENLNESLYSNWATLNPDTAREEQEKVGRRLRGKMRLTARDEEGAVFDQKGQLELAIELERQISDLEKGRNVGLAKAFLEAMIESDRQLLEMLESSLAQRLEKIVNDRLLLQPATQR